MFESLTKETLYEYPSFKVALFSILLSFVLSTVIAVTYYLTNRKLNFSRSFFQAMVLSSLVTCMVIMAVGNNIAAGFGIIGAIAIIRFRIRIQDPRNIIFIFATLSVGIAAGVYGYSIALSGTFVFCIVAGLLHYSRYGGAILNREFALAVTVSREIPEEVFSKLLVTFCERYRFIGISSTKLGSRHRYFLVLKNEKTKEEFYSQLEKIEGLSNILLERNDNLDRL